MSISLLHTKVLTNSHSNSENIRRSLREADIVTMSIGINDLKYYLSINDNMNDYKLNSIVKTITKDFDNLLKELNKYHPHKIYVIGYPIVDSTNIYLKQGIKKLNKSYKNNKKIYYINIDNLLNQKDFSNPSSIYPNNNGYKKISQVLQKKIKPLKNK